MTRRPTTCSLTASPTSAKRHVHTPTSPATWLRYSPSHDTRRRTRLVCSCGVCWRNPDRPRTPERRAAVRSRSDGWSVDKSLVSDLDLEEEAEPTRRSAKRTLELVALVVIVIAAVGILAVRLWPDPYGPGTDHRYTLVRTIPPGTDSRGCANPDPVTLDGRIWESSDPGSNPKWSDWEFPLPGTFHIHTDGEATFEPDIGGTITFHGGGHWSDLGCSVEDPEFATASP